MPKVHIWLYPFRMSEAELKKLGDDLSHLYTNKKEQKTWLYLDSMINSRSEWKENIRATTSGTNIIVTIYVLGHTNIDYQYISSDTGEKKGPLDLALAIYKVLQNVNKQATLKLKFMNCRSAFARYPRPVCEHVFRMTKRTFVGYAYAADISTLTKAEDGSGYLNYKQASIPTGGDTIAAMRAK
ncbi:MAG: hypothetical protein ACREBW_07105, partial [Candidatus Micrarchaeaceae archaeon]